MSEAAVTESTPRRTRSRTRATAPVALALDEALLGSPERFFNRELSWLAFNGRVLEEAPTPATRCWSGCGSCRSRRSNLDEFYMVRVAGLKGQVREGVQVVSQDGLTPAEQLAKINAAAAALMAMQQRLLARAPRRSWPRRASCLVEADELTDAERAWLEDEFLNRLFPVLTPLAIDPAHPFPFIPNLGFCLALELRRPSGRQAAARPGADSRPGRALLGAADAERGAGRRIIAVESGAGAVPRPAFSRAARSRRSGLFRLIRDSDMEIEEEAEDLVREFEARLKQRRLGSVVRVKIEASMPADLRDFIVASLHAEPQDVILVDGMLGVAAARPAHPARPRRPEVRGLRAALPRAHPRPRRRLLRGDPREGHPGPPPVRELRRGGAVPASGRARPQRAGDQADAVPHLEGQPDRRGPDRGGRGRQERHRPGGDQGPLRRGGQHLPGRGRPGAGRRPRRLRLRRVQDPRQALAGGAARGRRAEDLLPLRHGQLSPGHGRGFTPTCRCSRPTRRWAGMRRGCSTTSPAMPSPSGWRSCRSRRCT